MTTLIKIKGSKENIYYVEVYPNETFEDISNMLFHKYKIDIEHFKHEDKTYSKEQIISKIPNFNNLTIFSFEASTQLVSSDIKSKSENNINTVSKKELERNQNINKLIDKFKFSIRLSVPTETIANVLKNEFSDALGTDPDNSSRIKAAEHLIMAEGSAHDIKDYRKEDQKVLKKIMKKLPNLPLSVVAYTFFSSDRNEKATLKNLNDFLRKDSSN